MNLKEYKEYIKDMTREELLHQCEVMKANYDKSCRSWIHTEHLRMEFEECFSELDALICDLAKEVHAKYNILSLKYNNLVKETEKLRDAEDAELWKELSTNSDVK